MLYQLSSELQRRIGMLSEEDNEKYKNISVELSALQEYLFEKKE